MVLAVSFRLVVVSFIASFLSDILFRRPEWAAPCGAWRDSGSSDVP
jgi:hypothetical protein